MTVTVRKLDAKYWGVFIGEHQIGQVNSQSDADFHKNILDLCFKQEYNQGFKAGQADERLMRDAIYC